MIFASLKWEFLAPIKKRRGTPPKIEIFQNGFLIQPTYAKSQPINHAPGVLLNIFEKAPCIAYS